MRDEHNRSADAARNATRVILIAVALTALRRTRWSVIGLVLCLAITTKLADWGYHANGEWHFNGMNVVQYTSG